MIKCSVIKDLFTAYISGVGSEDTRALVDDHIASCEECRNKLTEAQGRVAAQLKENNSANVNVFKTMKKRIFRRNVLVAAIAVIACAAVVLSGISFVFGHSTPMPYDENAIKAVRTYADSFNELTGETTQVPVLDIVCTKNYDCSYGTQKIIDLNGERVNVHYFYLSETLYTKWTTNKNREFFMRFAKPFDMDPENGDTWGLTEFDRMEVYYMIKTTDEFMKINGLSDSEYYEQRKDGVLVWSGIIEK